MADEEDPKIKNPRGFTSTPLPEWSTDNSYLEQMRELALKSAPPGTDLLMRIEVHPEGMAMFVALWAQGEAGEGIPLKGVPLYNRNDVPPTSYRLVFRSGKTFEHAFTQVH